MVRSVAAGEGRRLPRKLLYARDPRWSPDGKSLIVGGGDGKGRDGVYQVDVETGNFTSIVPARLGAVPRWSADGAKIYYKDQAQERVVERDLRSGAEREVVRHPSVQNIEISPDGRTLALLADVESPAASPSSPAKSLLLVSIADGSARELMRLTAQETFRQTNTFVWTPDSHAILVAKRAASQPELWSIDVVSGKLRRFDVDATDWAAAMTGPEANTLDGGFALSADGTHIAFLMGKSGAEVWALENFLPSPAANRQAATK